MRDGRDPKRREQGEEGGIVSVGHTSRDGRINPYSAGIDIRRHNLRL